MSDAGMSCNEVVKTLFRVMKERKLTHREVERRSGIGVNVMGRWQRHREPLLGNAIAALNAIGLDIVVVERPGYQQDQLHLFDKVDMDMPRAEEQSALTVHLPDDHQA